MIVSNTEWLNSNSYRKYPFADSASMLDTNGVLLPTDFIVDMHLFPIDLAGFPYLSAVSSHSGELYFADSATGVTFGVAAYTAAGGAVEVLDGSNRVVGMVVLGDSAGVVLGATRAFTADATMLAPTAYTPVNQTGVRGIQLPDGSVVTGHVTFEGVDGVNVVTTHTLDGRMILRVDVIGVPPTTAKETPICTILVQQSEGASLAVSKYGDSALALTVPTMELDSLCEAKKAVFRKSTVDPCHPIPVPPPEPVSVPEVFIMYQVCALGTNTWMLVAPSAAGYVNPVMITPIASGLSPSRLVNPSGQSVDEASQAAADFASPANTAGGINLELQGIP